MQSHPDLVLIKLGGSAITDKQRLETLKPGSFGHYQAKASGLAKGGSSNPALRQGFAATRASVLKLNQHTVGALLASGLPATSLSPCGVWAKQGSHEGITAVRTALKFGLVPVLHGDCVFDATQGCVVLSGDQIIAELAIALRPQCTVFMTDVDGLYDRPPSQPDAELIREVNVREDGTWGFGDGRTDLVTTTAEHDVTGGIAAKIQAAADIARHGLRVWIVRAGSESAAKVLQEGDDLLDDESWSGTLVRPDVAKSQ